MPRMSKKDKLYWAFFIDPATGRRKEMQARLEHFWEMLKKD